MQAILNVRWETDRVIPPGLKVNQLILKAGREARPGCILIIATQTFSALGISAGGVSVWNILWRWETGQRRPEELGIPRDRLDLSRPA